MTNIHDYLNGIAQLAGKDAIDNTKQEDLYKYNMDYRMFYDNCKTPDIILPTPVITETPIILDFSNLGTRITRKKSGFDSSDIDWANTIVRF